MKIKDLELDIKVGNRSIVVKSDNKIEFPDAMNLSIEELEYIVEESKTFIEYKEIREKVNEQQNK